MRVDTKGQGDVNDTQSFCSVARSRGFCFRFLLKIIIIRCSKRKKKVVNFPGDSNFFSPSEGRFDNYKYTRTHKTCRFFFYYYYFHPFNGRFFLTNHCCCSRDRPENPFIVVIIDVRNRPKPKRVAGVALLHQRRRRRPELLLP